MKHFDEKAAQEMRVKAYQERERKRLEVRLQTRGLFCDEACTKSTKKKKCESTKRQGLPAHFHTCRLSS